MKKTMRKIMIVLAAALMVMMMAVPTFASTVSANVHFVTYNEFDDQLEDILGRKYDITAVSETQSVSFETNNFTSVIPGATASNHQYMNTPTVMDAIYSAYLTNHGSASGWQSYWDTTSSPKGSYITTMYGNPQITQYLSSTYWGGYAWMIYLNPTSWPSSSGELQYYASNVPLTNGDNIYVLYDFTSQSW